MARLTQLDFKIMVTVRVILLGLRLDVGVEELRVQANASIATRNRCRHSK